MKVSVYTLQFMFIKIKWETREGRWEKGGRPAGGYIQDTRQAHALRGMPRICVSNLSRSRREGRQTVWGKMSKEHYRVIQNGFEEEVVLNLLTMVCHLHLLGSNYVESNYSTGLPQKTTLYPLIRTPSPFLANLSKLTSPRKFGTNSRRAWVRTAMCLEFLATSDRQSHKDGVSLITHCQSWGVRQEFN